jgi:hypothetical protein
MGLVSSLADLDHARDGNAPSVSARDFGCSGGTGVAVICKWDPNATERASVKVIAHLGDQVSKQLNARRRPR